MSQGEFQGEWTAPAAEFTATQPRVSDWSEGAQVPCVPVQPEEDWSAQPATDDGSAAPTAQATERGGTTAWSYAVLQTLKQKREIRLMENKGSKLMNE